MASCARLSFAADTIFIALVICWVFLTLPIRFRIARRFAMMSPSPRLPLFPEDAPELLEGGGELRFHGVVNDLPLALSSVMILVVTGVGFLIHVYSVGYMSHEKAFARYFVYLNLFTFAMLVLVLGSNYLVMFVGWEGVGLCSYLLIGYWYEKKSASDAGKK